MGARRKSYLGSSKTGFVNKEHESRARDIWILASEINSWVKIRVHIYIIIIVGAVGGYICEKRSKLPHC